MTPVTVTLSVGTTIHYWFVPQAAEGTSGLILPEIVYGWATGTPDELNPLSLTLDSDFVYDVQIEGRGVPPIIFPTFKPAAGELLTLLAAQGWVSL